MKDLKLDINRSDVFSANKAGAPAKDKNKDIALSRSKTVAFTEAEYSFLVDIQKSKGYPAFSHFMRDIVLKSLGYYE